MRSLLKTVVVGLSLGVVVALFAQVVIESPFVQRGQASYYADLYEGRLTASGEVFRQADITGASWTWIGYDVRVTNLKNGKSVVVRINDRGPAKRLVARGRIVDLSKAAFLAISHDGLRPGLLHVKVEPLSRR